MSTNKCKLQRVENWISLARLANWSATKLAKDCNVSMSTLKRFFLRRMGKTPKAWLTEQRQYQAKAAIECGLSVKESAFQLGYQHPTQFSRDFKKFWGRSPSDYSLITSSEPRKV